MLNKINLFKLDKRKIMIATLIIIFISIGISFTANGILFKNTQNLKNKNKNKNFDNEKLIVELKKNQEKFDEFKWKIKELGKNLNKEELEDLLKIFFDPSKNPILKFKLKDLLDEIQKDDENIKYSVLLNNNEENTEEDEKLNEEKVDLPPSEVVTKKIYEYLINDKNLLKELLIKRNELINLKIKKQKQIELINKIFINLINEKKSKLNLIKNWFLKITTNLENSNKELQLKKRYKKNLNKNAEYDEIISKLDIERFWLWTKTKKSRFIWWEKLNPRKSIFPMYHEIRKAGNFVHWVGTQNISLYKWMRNDIYRGVRIGGIYSDFSFKNKELNQESITKGWGYIYRKNFNDENIEKIRNILKNINIYLENTDIFLNKEKISKEDLNIFLEKETIILNLIKNFKNLFIKNMKIISDNIKDNPYLKEVYSDKIEKQLQEFEELKKRKATPMKTETPKETDSSNFKINWPKQQWFCELNWYSDSTWLDELDSNNLFWKDLEYGIGIIYGSNLLFPLII